MWFLLGLLATTSTYVASSTPSIPPIMERIAFCESSNRHFNLDGTVLRGKVDSDDIGRYQVNLRYHQKKAESMNIDLFSEKGNEEYAIYLYQKEGLKPWSASKACWQPFVQPEGK